MSDDVAVRFQARAARVAVAAVFLVNGAVIGGWAAVIPEVEAGLGLGHDRFGLALLAMAAGALLAMPLAGALVARRGSRVVAVVAGLLDCALVVLPVLAGGLLPLAGALLLLGAANGAMDVAMNAQGVAVERRLGRPILASLHGLYSVGGLVGAGLGVVALPGIGPLAFVAALAAGLAAVMALAAFRLLPRAADDTAGGSPFARPSAALAGLGAMAFLVLMAEGAVVDWSGILLKTGFGAGPGLAAAGFALFAGAMAAGRLVGDALRLRVAAVTLVRAGAIAAAGGLALAVSAPVAPLALAGLVLAGLGIANVVPILFAAAGTQPDRPAGPAIAAVTTMGYAGFLVGPPLIGHAGAAFGIDRALGLLVVALAAVALGARAVRRH